MDNSVGTVPDDQVVSEATLEELAVSPAPVTGPLVHLITTADLTTVPSVDTFTAGSLDALAVASSNEASAAGAEASVPRDAITRACQRGALSGYLLARVLLGTHDRPVNWLSPPSPEVLAPIHDMELCFEMPPMWAEITIEAISRAVQASGFADPEPDEPIGCATALVFDKAVAIALIEHDRWLARGPR